MNAKWAVVLILSCAAYLSMWGFLAGAPPDPRCVADMDHDGDVDTQDWPYYRDSFGAQGMDCNDPGPLAELSEVIAEWREIMVNIREDRKVWLCRAAANKACFQEWARRTGHCDPNMWEDK